MWSEKEAEALGRWARHGAPGSERLDRGLAEGEVAIGELKAQRDRGLDTDSDGDPVASWGGYRLSRNGTFATRLAAALRAFWARVLGTFAIVASPRAVVRDRLSGR
jgi:hypothetical protein